MQYKTLVMGLPRWQQAFLRRHRLPDACLPYAQQWFVLLAQRLAEHQIGAGRTVLVALNGTQGSGKTTVCVYRWRMEQEQKLAEHSRGDAIMNTSQVAR